MSDDPTRNDFESRLRSIEALVRDHKRLLRGDERYADPGLWERQRRAEEAIREMKEAHSKIDPDEVIKNSEFRERVIFGVGVLKYIGPLVAGAGLIQVVRWILGL